jgi:hypothetical protein
MRCPSGSRLEVSDHARARFTGGTVKKSDREIMEILEAFDATGCAHSAAGIVKVDPKTVRRYFAAREEGRPVTGPGRRPRIIDPYLAKVEEWVDRSEGKVRADVVHERLQAVGFTGDGRTTRRAVAEVKAAWRAGRRRTYRPWITEPGLWTGVRLGRGPGGARPGRADAGDVAVLRVAGVVAVPGDDPDLGPSAGDAVGLPGRDAAQAGWGADVCVDR